MAYFPEGGFTVFAKKNVIEISELIKLLSDISVLGVSKGSENGVHSFQMGEKFHEMFNLNLSVFTEIYGVYHSKVGYISNSTGEIAWKFFPYWKDKIIAVGDGIMVKVLKGKTTDYLEKNNVIAVENCGVEMFADEDTLNKLYALSGIKFEIDISKYFA
jgi:hypothetical protein